MTNKYPLTNIPIHQAIIAWQPKYIRPWGNSVARGQVTVVHKGNLRELAFFMTHGAGWPDWEEDTADVLVRYLLKLKQDIARDYEIAPCRIESAFRHIREFRVFRVEQRRLREKRKNQKRRISVRTR